MKRGSSVRALTLGVGLLVLATEPPLAAPVVVDFDDVAADGIIGNALGIYPGNQYASSGVLFRTGSIAGAVAVGNIVTLTSSVDQFEVLGGPGQPAISGPNFAIPKRGGLSDLLMIFTIPVTSVTVTSDDYPETPDVIRLLALGATATPNSFEVLALDQKLDDAVAPPDNVLSVDLGGTAFSFALFEVTTEQEGFDDLSMTFQKQAVVDLDPNVVNLRSHAPWVTAYIEPLGFDPASIDLSTLRLAGSVPAAPKFATIGDHDADEVPDLMVKFSREALDPLLTPGVNELALTGSLVTGEDFEGRDEIRVINPPNAPLSASVAPNPLNPVGVLRFSTTRSGPARVAIFDAQGRLVRALMDTPALPTGTHTLPVDGRGDQGQVLASGIYFYRVEAVEGSVVGRIAIQK